VRGARPAGEVLEGDLVRGDHAGARAGLDRHVAHRHALIHRQGLDGGAPVLDDVSGAPVHPDLADDGEDQVLGGDPLGAPAADVDGERLRLLLQQALGGEHVADLGGADAEGERADRPVGARMAVAADDGLPGLAQAELRADDVHDAALRMVHRQELDAELGAVVFQLRHLARRGVERNGRAAEHLGAAGRGRMVHGGERAVGAPHGEAALAQYLEGLRGSDLVDEVQVDVEHRGDVRRAGRDLVALPHLVEEGARRLHHRWTLFGCGGAQPEAATRGAAMST